MFSQDSTKILSHEVGFNTVSLIKLVLSNSNLNSSQQLPYLLFYNIAYKNMFGIRTGFGVNNSTVESSVSGQVDNRESIINNFNMRIGGFYVPVNTKKITANLFADFIYGKTKAQTLTTTTVQSFPNPLSTTKTDINDVTKQFGAEVGVGVKFNFYKNLSLYTEVPVVFSKSTATSIVNITQDGISDKTTTNSSLKNINIIVPATLYLILNF
ncbi:MAG: hypothetical protein K2Q23_14085 [Bryobacteraceae bacterium]|nr:hypothetical protein [Bryobacteraceae bacterium]